MTARGAGTSADSRKFTHSSSPKGSQCRKQPACSSCHGGFKIRSWPGGEQGWAEGSPHLQRCNGAAAQQRGGQPWCNRVQLHSGLGELWTCLLLACFSLSLSLSL